MHFYIQRPDCLMPVHICLQSAEDSVPATDRGDQVQVLSRNEEVHQHSEHIPRCQQRCYSYGSYLPSNDRPQCQRFPHLLLQSVRAIQETRLCAERVQSKDFFTVSQSLQSLILWFFLFFLTDYPLLSVKLLTQRESHIILTLFLILLFAPCWHMVHQQVSMYRW